MIGLGRLIIERLRLLGKVCARSPTKLLESLHRLVKADARRVQVDARRFGVRVPQQLLHDVERHATFHPPRARLTPEVVEMQIDAAELDAEFSRQLPTLPAMAPPVGAFMRALIPSRGEPVGSEDARLPGTVDARELLTDFVAEDVRVCLELFAGRIVTSHLQDAGQPGRDRNHAVLAVLCILSADVNLSAGSIDVAPLEL